MKKVVKTLGLALVATLTMNMTVAQVTPNVNQLQESSSDAEAKVSDEEVDMFVEAFKGVQAVNQKNQQEMLAALDDVEMEVQRFSEIQQKKQDPSQESEITEAEQAKLDKVMPKLEEIQKSSRSNMEEAIKKSGLSMTRYQEIAMLVQKDSALQQRIKTKMQP